MYTMNIPYDLSIKFDSNYECIKFDISSITYDIINKKMIEKCNEKISIDIKDIIYKMAETDINEIQNIYYHVLFDSSNYINVYDNLISSITTLSEEWDTTEIDVIKILFSSIPDDISKRLSRIIYNNYVFSTFVESSFNMNNYNECLSITQIDPLSKISFNVIKLKNNRIEGALSLPNYNSYEIWKFHKHIFDSITMKNEKPYIAYINFVSFIIDKFKYVKDVFENLFDTNDIDLSSITNINNRFNVEYEGVLFFKPNDDYSEITIYDEIVKRYVMDIL